MVFPRIISRFPGRSRMSNPTQKRLCPLNSNAQVPKPPSQIAQKHDLFSGISENYQGRILSLHNAMPRFLGNMGIKLGFAQENPLPCSLKFASSIHSVGPNEFERGMGNRPVDTEQNSESFEGSNQRQPPIDIGQNSQGFDSFIRGVADIDRTRAPIETGRPFGRPTDIGQNAGGFESFTRGLADMDRTRGPIQTGRDGSRPFGIGRGFGQFESGRPVNFVRRENENYRLGAGMGTENNAHVVHIKIMRNNTFVTVTDSKGEKKMGWSAGCLAEMKGGPKVSKYSAEATAEHVGREAKKMGLKSVVVKVNGFTFFKKKKLAILSFRDGYTNSRSDRNPIVYIEDTTRKPHNGCRRKKQRRV